MDERWCVVPGYEGRYEVSTFGNVRALERSQEFVARWGVAKMRFPAKVLKAVSNPVGYRYVCISKDGKSRKWFIHRLVLLAFVGDSDLQANHKDGDKSNNNLDNLEYCTARENLNHCINVLGKKRGEGSGTAKLTENKVRDIRSDARRLGEIAKDYGVTLQAIHLIKARKNWRHVQ